VKPRVLVVGARPNSLGSAVMQAAQSSGFDAYSAGVFAEEYTVDLITDSYERLKEAFVAIHPQHVVCTAGMNEPDRYADPGDWLAQHMAVNAVGPLRLLEAFAEWAPRQAYDAPRHYVAISSNSAFLPRTGSMAYCASKAALSQGLRVKGREAVGGDNGWICYGYEPGLLAGTPMTVETERRFSGALHRMRGKSVERGIPVDWLAAQIVSGLKLPGVALNGTLVRYDGGEL
jgi:NAD(P)-dependent dehydrogenase (short-subunit alcohol dehydrogenase family)